MQMTAPDGVSGIMVAGVDFVVDEARQIAVDAENAWHLVALLIRAGFAPVDAPPAPEPQPEPDPQPEPEA